MWTCNRLDLQTLGSLSTGYAQTSPPITALDIGHKFPAADKCHPRWREREREMVVEWVIVKTRISMHNLVWKSSMTVRRDFVWGMKEESHEEKWIHTSCVSHWDKKGSLHTKGVSSQPRARSHVPRVGPRYGHASFIAQMKSMLLASCWGRWDSGSRHMVHVTHIECTSSSTSKIQYLWSLSLSKYNWLGFHFQSETVKNRQSM